MSDSRQTRHGTQLHDDQTDGLPFAAPSSAFASRLPDDGPAERPRRPEDALAEIESLERLLADTSAESDGFCPVPAQPRVIPVKQCRRIEVSPCVVCYGTTATTRFAIEACPEELVVCDTCGLGSVFPLPSPQRIAALRAPAPSATGRSTFGTLSQWTTRLQLSWLLRSVPRGGRVLEITSGHPSDPPPQMPARLETRQLRLFRDDVTDTRPPTAGRRGHQHGLRELADERFPSRSFDAVVLWHSLQYQPRPDRTLDELRRIIRPGGQLIVAVPNFASWQAGLCGADWRPLNLPRHLYHFTPDTLRRLLHRHEFETDATHSSDVWKQHLSPLRSRLFRGTTAPRWLPRRLLQNSGTLIIAARLSNLQTVDSVLRSVAPTGIASAFA